MRLPSLAPAALAAAAFASTTAPGAALGAAYYSEPRFVEPAGWAVGDAGSTHQLWDEFPSGVGNTIGPDAGAWIANPAAGNAPTLTFASPGFIPGPGRSYSFGGDYGVTASISNATSGDTPAPGLGTHVVVQIASSINVTGVLRDTLHLLDGDGNVLLDGGEALDALQAAAHDHRPVAAGPFGGSNFFEETIFEFFLPGYTGDFTVAWMQTIHSGIEAVRVDSFLASAALPITPVPEPASLALVAAGALLALRRR